MNSIIPMRGQLLIESVEDELKINEQIVVVKNKKRVDQCGKVLAVGKPRRDQRGKEIHMDVQEGDVVYFSRYKQKDYDKAKQRLMVIKQEHVVAIKKEAL